jgi:acetoin utilization deacetylase AcuC-like enzyme
MLPFPLIYHDDFDLNLGDHVFPSSKYRLVRDRMLNEHFTCEQDFLKPEPATDEDLLLVHDRGWVTRLKHGTLSYQEIIKLEIPYSRKMVDAFWLAAGGTTLAARQSLEKGLAYTIGGGFHHAYPGHGEGFCAIHDVAVAVRVLQHENKIEKAMIVDTDVHHGNGTAAIFCADSSVFTLSIHQFNNYPQIKPPSTLDIHLEDGCEDDEYLKRLSDGYLNALHSFKPDLVMYVAGADPYREDQLGGLMLTMDGLKDRDKLVIEAARKQGAAVAITLAGGYAWQVQDTVTIHCNTAKAAAEVAAAIHA